MVMTPDFESEDRGFKPQLGHSTGNFSSHVYFSSYYTMGALFRFLSTELPSDIVNLWMSGVHAYDSRKSLQEVARDTVPYL